MLKSMMVGLVSALVLSVTVSADAGDIRGRQEATKLLEAGGSHFYTRDFIFREGEGAEVWVRGAGNVDIDCWLFDADGNLMDSDTDSTSTCLLEVTPAWTGRFSVKIKNLGDYSTVYKLTTN
jgi:hypothetical protein